MRLSYIVAMYIRVTTRRYKDKVYTNHLLVESVHTPKGPRQKVICSLGDLSPRPAAEWLRLAHKVEDALVGQTNLLSLRWDKNPRLQANPSGFAMFGYEFRVFGSSTGKTVLDERVLRGVER